MTTAAEETTLLLPNDDAAAAEDDDATSATGALSSSTSPLTRQPAKALSSANALILRRWVMRITASGRATH